MLLRPQVRDEELESGCESCCEGNLKSKGTYVSSMLLDECRLEGCELSGTFSVALMCKQGDV